ncbi:hypothetical protein PCANC_05868 [Puccinia coronata f. sp. avenae]|uniref:Uncharacterized protein n=1 Tax=Puccinia coronata f. sp. avenae TaxID=200324 RepID=A0A2N5VBL9_9BASI|nr:hypothetical protein PCANC_05868 [Puccinia coronata f. sp. avenae]
MQRLHALPRTLHVICTPSIRRAGVRPCQTGVQSLHACLEWRAKPARSFGQACRLCTPVGSRYFGTLIRVHGTLIRVLWYPYKGYFGTLIRVHGTLIRVHGTLIRVLWYPYKGYFGTLIRVHGTLIRVPKYPYQGYFGTLIRVLWITLASQIERLT